MKKECLLISFMFLCGIVGIKGQNQYISYTPDFTSVLRNPAMGWTMYEEGWSFEGKRANKNNIYTPEVFWQQMEEFNAPKYSNILYIRILWADLEPEEGKYAWIYNEKYKWYIQKAKEHGLKLAFRVFFHGVDGVPKYVYDAGAKQSPIDGEGKTQPYYDDPIFLEKLDRFIAAFAKEYDKPELVDFIDAYGLGRWGEGHGLTLLDKENKRTVIEKVTNSYANHFKNILTIINLSSADYQYTKPLVFDKLGFLPRRDGIGSFWYSNEERAMIHDELFPEKAVIGEGCYWFNAMNGDNSKYTAFKQDKRFSMKNFKEAFTVSVTDALNNHSNTLDLRVPLQCKFWIEELPDEVQRFISLGGYRFYPDFIKVEQVGHQINLLHSWKNNGVGVLPNNHPNWNHKYKIGFALMDSNHKIKYIHTETKAEPADWLKGFSYPYLSALQIPQNLNGKYTLYVGIINTRNNNTAEIDLAVAKSLKKGKWVKVAELTLSRKK